MSFEETMTTATPNLNASAEAELPKRSFNATSIGYFLLTISFSAFCVVEFADTEWQNNYFAIFIGHYLLAGAYVVLLFVEDSYGIVKSWRKENLANTVVLLMLFLVSAYALNRELPVFEDSTDGLCIYLLITSANLLSFRFFKILPRWANAIQLLILGSAIVLYLYMVFFVVEFYFVGVIGIILLGIGAHVFVPLALFVVSVFIIIHTRNKGVSIGWLAGGTLITLCGAGIFVKYWNDRVATVEKFTNQSVLYAPSELPLWVNVSQEMPNDWLSQRIIKSDLVYTVAGNKFNDWVFVPGPRTWEEPRKHDPLVFVASMFSKTSISRNERIQILEAVSDHHRSQDRLWSGENLSTSYVITDIDIWADLRLAYTEKYLNIKNSGRTRSWNPTEEAIYTFQLPEGSVVTSLSLWVNGKEEKAILTSKQKAKQAYNAIVGVERRDPSVVHWQEGNTVSVRVFPCTPNEERKFKIGVTSPLAVEGGNLIYKNIIFKGPSANDANETMRVRFVGEQPNVSMPHSFRKDKKGDYVSENTYNSNFELSFSAPVFREQNGFVFDGYQYALKPVQLTFRPFTNTELYLDINETWTRQELDEIKPLLQTTKILAHTDGEFVQLTADSWNITEDLQKRSFTLFPFHHLKNPEQSLVVTKGRTLTPYLADIKESAFAENVSKFFAAGKKANVYNLGTDVSTYIRSLRELRALHFAQGDFKQLKNWLEKKHYPQTTETSETVTLHDANLEITRKKIEDSGAIHNAPDHLARLFAYNDVMRQVGVHYFDNDYVNEALVDEAATAYIVSPVSSLIVLESQEDYKRFGIEDKANSLHNASKNASGAVPEPHEWALIILFLLFVLYVSFRNKLKPVA